MARNATVALLLAACVLVFHAMHAVHAAKVGGWATQDVPNPMTSPAECGRQLAGKSSVCDPDKLLSDESKDVIEGYINKMKVPTQIGVLVIEKMAQRQLDTSGNDIEAAGELMARGIHDKWGVGDKTKHDGVVIFLSITDRYAYISRGVGLRRTLSSAVINGIIEHMRPWLRKQDYEKALSTAVLEIDMVLDGQPLPESSNREGWVFIAFFLVMIAFMAV